MSKLSKKMYERCLNKDWTVWAKMDEEVKEVLRETLSRVDFLDDCLKWNVLIGQPFFGNGVYRINPDAPHEEADMIELPVSGCWAFGPVGFTEYRVEINGVFQPTLHACVSCVQFSGIVYDLDGVQTTRTTIDAAFGVPKKVLFRQEDETK